MHGPLNEIGLVEVLQLLERGKRSGRLMVIGGQHDEHRTITIGGGRIVDLMPLTEADLLLHLAIRALVPAGTVRAAPELLETARQELATSMLIEMLTWSTGRFDFTAGKVDCGPLDVAPAALMMQLVAGESARTEMAEAVAGYAAVPRFASPREIAGGAPLVLDNLDWRIIDRVDGRRDIAGLAQDIREPAETVARAALRLAAAAIIHLDTPTGDPIALARAALDQGEVAAAIGILAERVAAAPQDGEAWRWLGFAEVRMGRIDRASAAWQAWVNTSPVHHFEAAPLLAAAETMMAALRGAVD